ncbi:MAG TPA: hypothetical protein VGJ51_07915, partial [Candidatus Angelobacter sp.]
MRNNYEQPCRIKEFSRANSISAILAVLAILAIRTGSYQGPGFSRPVSAVVETPALAAGLFSGLTASGGSDGFANSWELLIRFSDGLDGYEPEFSEFRRFPFPMKRREDEWRNAENAFSTMPHQGVLTSKFNFGDFGSAG